ncbi:MAG: hypothetical protein MI739_04930 [Bacteroidales bacterium]|nr:hypothetical protein [Bacteroidales bacterium]
MNRKKDYRLLFIIPNIVASSILMVYYVLMKPNLFPANIIPSYFFGVIAALVTMYVFHPNKHRKSLFKLLNWIMLFVTVVLIFLYFIR